MPLLWAAHYDGPEILSRLSRKGASVNHTDPNGRTILHVVISQKLRYTEVDSQALAIALLPSRSESEKPTPLCGLHGRTSPP